MGSEWQTQVSNSLLVEIFGYLELQGLGRAAQVCRRWSEVVRHDGLWHSLARRRWNIKGALPQGQTSWREEVKRLIHHVPLVQSEVLFYHKDEILDVSISHDGRYFATTSKDTLAVLWRFGKRDTLSCGSVDTKHYLKWTTSHSSAFNKSDSLLMVAGVIDGQEYCEGKGVILTVPDMAIVMEVSLNPYTLDGAWLTDRIVTGGRCDVTRDVAMIQAYEVTDENITRAKELNRNTPEGQIILHKQGRTIFSCEASLCHQMNIIVASVLDLSDKRQQQCDDASGTQRETRNSVVKMDTDSSEQEIVPEMDSSHGSLCQCTLSSKRNECTNGCESKCTQEVTCTCEAAHGSRTSDPDLNVRITKPTDSTRRAGLSLEAGKRTYIAMVTGIHDIIGIQEVTQAGLDAVLFPETEEMSGNTSRPLLEKFDHQLHLENCYITGLCLSHDHRYLYFNYRELDESVKDNHLRADYARMFKQNLTIGTFDLTSMTRLRNIEYTGHLAFSSCPVWYICLRTSKDFIGSGSEDAKAYIWDRHHRVMLGKLGHHEGVLNGIAFSPVDQEVCVTVCDDKLVKIWKSRNRMADVVEAECDE